MALVIASTLPYHVGTDGQRHYWQVKETDDRWQAIHGWDGMDGIEWREIGRPYRSRDDAIERATSYAKHLSLKNYVAQP